MLNIQHPDYPEEYILGRVQFFSKDFVITPDVLIPRLETECLVRKARNIARTYEECSLIDIGTGS
jgi:release factor glutamine methyltransferase